MCIYDMNLIYMLRVVTLPSDLITVGLKYEAHYKSIMCAVLPFAFFYSTAVLAADER
jgi:hypothetical protein